MRARLAELDQDWPEPWRSLRDELRSRKRVPEPSVEADERAMGVDLLVVGERLEVRIR
jgi:hypothetical protein